METGAKVKMRGVEVGRVAAIKGGSEPVSLKLDIFTDQAHYIPANVEAQIRATTAFGAKYVDLIYPDKPSPTATSRRGGVAVAQCQHRGEHGLPEPVGVLDQIDVSEAERNV